MQMRVSPVCLFDNTVKGNGMNIEGVEVLKDCPCVDPCPADAIFRFIGGKWKLKVLCTLHYNGVLRYGEIKRMIKGVSPTMLANSLRELEEDGLITRTIYDEMPVRVEYRMTEAGYSLVPILDELREWAIAYRPEDYKTIE